MSDMYINTRKVCDLLTVNSTSDTFKVKKSEAQTDKKSLLVLNLLRDETCHALSEQQL